LAAILDFERATRVASGHPGWISLRHLELLKKAEKRLLRDQTRLWVLPLDYNVIISSVLYIFMCVCHVYYDIMLCYVMLCYILKQVTLTGSK